MPGTDQLMVQNKHKQPSPAVPVLLGATTKAVGTGPRNTTRTAPAQWPLQSSTAGRRPHTDAILTHS